MKKILFLLVLLFPMMTFALPIDQARISINKITCPNGAQYAICGGVNAELHNKFVNAMKKFDAYNAIKFWNQMSHWKRDSGDDTLPNFLYEPIFGMMNINNSPILPAKILSQKTYKGGILILGNDAVHDFRIDGYYISFLRYKSDGKIYIYNQQLVPEGSVQYDIYTQLYSRQHMEHEIDMETFETDIVSAFDRGKFNNKDTNIVYQNFVNSIKDIPGVSGKNGLNNDRTFFDNYRIKSGVIQYKVYDNTIPGYKWINTDFDPNTVVFYSATNGKDKNGSFYGATRLRLNGENVFFEPIGRNQNIADMRFWSDGTTSNVYVLNFDGVLGILPGANVSSLIVFEKIKFHSENMNTVCNYTKFGDINTLAGAIFAIDDKNCYGTTGNPVYTPIENLMKRR